MEILEAEALIGYQIPFRSMAGIRLVTQGLAGGGANKQARIQVSISVSEEGGGSHSEAILFRSSGARGQQIKQRQSTVCSHKAAMLVQGQRNAINGWVFRLSA